MYNLNKIKNQNKISNFIYIIAAALIAVVIIGLVTTSYQNQQNYTITITDKQVKNSKESSTYLIFATTKDGEQKVFKDSDLLFIGKFNSSDLFGEMQTGKTYKVTTLGYRFQILSMYQNIIQADEVK